MFKKQHDLVSRKFIKIDDGLLTLNDKDKKIALKNARNNF